MAEEIRLDVVAVGHNRGLTETARELHHIKGEADDVTRSFGDLEDGSFSLDHAIEETRTEVKRLHEEFARTGQQGFLREVRDHEAALRRLEHAAKAITPDVGGGGGSAATMSLRSIQGPAIAAVAGLGVALAPAIGAIISGAVVGTVAGGGIIGGIVAAGNDSRVQGAWKDFTSTLSAQDFGADAFVQPTINAIGTLETAFNDLHIGDEIAKGAGSVVELTKGLTGFVEGVMPGFSAVMDDADKYTRVFSDGLAGTGEALGDMIVDLTESEGTVKGLRYGFELMNATIKGTGDVLKGLGDAFNVMVVGGASASGALEDIANWGGVVSPPLGLVGGMIEGVNDRLETLRDGAPHLHSLAEAVDHAGTSAAERRKNWQELMDAIDGTTRASMDYMKLTMTVPDAADDVEKAIDDLTESLKENGRTIDAGTEKGRANRDAVRDAISAAQAHRQAIIELNGDTILANALYAEEIKRIEGIAKAAHISAKELQEMAGNYRINVNVTTSYKQVGNPSGSAGAPWGGGYQERAEGGPVMADVPYLINERGPETVTFPAGGTVHPAHLTPMVGGGMNARPLQLNGGGLGDVVLSWIAGEVQARGGTLAVLGIRD